MNADLKLLKASLDEMDALTVDEDDGNKNDPFGSNLLTDTTLSFNSTPKSTDIKSSATPSGGLTQNPYSPRQGGGDIQPPQGSPTKRDPCVKCRRRGCLNDCDPQNVIQPVGDDVTVNCHGCFRHGHSKKDCQESPHNQLLSRRAQTAWRQNLPRYVRRGQGHGRGHNRGLARNNGPVLPPQFRQALEASNPASSAAPQPISAPAAVATTPAPTAGGDQSAILSSLIAALTAAVPSAALTALPAGNLAPSASSVPQASQAPPVPQSNELVFNDTVYVPKV